MNRCLSLSTFQVVRVSRVLLARASPLQSQIFRNRNASSVSTNSVDRKLSIPRRMKRFLDENPFTQIALLVCVLVVGVASLVEWSHNKRRAAKFGNRTAFPSLSPAPCHPVLAMVDEVALIIQQMPSVRFFGTRTVSIVGGSGAGKSELARQVAETLLQREKRVYRSDVHVLTLDISSRDSLAQSLLQSAALLQIPQSQLSIASSNAMDNDKVAEVLKAISQRLKRKQVVCIIDNATDTNMKDNAILFSKQHWDIPSLFIITSRQPLEGSAKLEINLDNRKLDQFKLAKWIEQFGIDKANSDKLANIFSEIHTNFEAFSLICHCLTLLRDGANITVNTKNLKSIVSALHEQLPKELRMEIDRMGFSGLDQKNQLQLLALTLFSASNQLNQHTVDLFARLSPKHSLPLSTLITYLESPFYELQEELKERTIVVNELDNELEENEGKESKPESEMGYWELIKQAWKTRKEMIELLKKQKQLNTINRIEMPTVLQVLKESPLFRWEYDSSNGFESVKFCNKDLNGLALGIFQQRTIPQMEEATVNRARSLHTSSLLSKLSTFNPTLHLLKYRASLPGVSKSTAVSDPNSVHNQSLLHRITQALIKDFNSEGEQVKHRLISQHGDYLLRATAGHITSEDRVVVLRLRAALLKHEDDVMSAITTLREVAGIQKSNQSTPLVELARTYAQLGKLSLLQHTETGHGYYEQAANLFERAISKLTTPQQVEYGSLLYKYGVEMSYEKKLGISKVCLEKSLALLNVAAAQTPTTTGQPRIQELVLSSMVELAHVYLALGAHTYADKLLSMAENMSKTLGSSKDNPDLAQLYNLKAVLKSLSGDKQGYVKMKQQAGDVLATVEDKPFLY